MRRDRSQGKRREVGEKGKKRNRRKERKLETTAEGKGKMNRQSGVRTG